MLKLLSPLLRISTITSISATFLVGTAGNRPAIANRDNDFQKCAGYLQEIGLTTSLIAEACGNALDPEELSQCVAFINYYTEIPATTALAGCFQVRQPEKLAECVVSIEQEIGDPNQLAVLDFCQRSLIPTRFSDCVIGLTRQIEIAPTAAMRSCIGESNVLR